MPTKVDSIRTNDASFAKGLHGVLNSVNERSEVDGVQKPVVAARMYEEAPLMGELQSPDSMHPHAEAVKSLGNWFKAARIGGVDGQDIFRSLVAGIMWANDHMYDVFPRCKEVEGSDNYDRVFSSLQRFVENRTFVHDEMNDQEVSDEWVAFLRHAVELG